MSERKIGVGVGVMILREGKVLLGQRHPNKEKASSELQGQGQWTMPGGKLDPGESFEEAALRETKEETGLDLQKVEVLCVNNDIAGEAHYVTIGLLGTDFEGEPEVMEPDTIVRWEWFDPEDLPSPMYRASTKVLRNYTEGKFYIKQ